MIRVLFIVPSLRRAGAEAQIIDLVNAIDPERFEIHLLAFERDLAQLDRVDQSRVRFHHVVRRSKYDTSFIGEIAALVDEFHIELIHCTLQFSLLVAWLARAKARRSPQLVAAIHTTLNRGVKEELHDRLMYQWLLRACAGVIFVCHNQAEYWYRRYAFLKDRSRVVYNGVDISRYERSEAMGNEFRHQYGIADSVFLIGCIAGFRPEKGHQILVDAIKQVSGDVVLVLAGEGETRAIVEGKVRENGLQDRVRFVGNLSDVRPLLSACDLTVLASTAVETFSIAMLESMAMGVPMLATDIGGLSEAILPGQTGVLVQPGDVGELAVAIQKLVEQSDLVKEMGRRARALVEQEFSVNVMARETADLLSQVMVDAADSDG